MKKKLSIICVLLVGCFFDISAQTRVCNLKTYLVNPGKNAVVSGLFNLSFYVKNYGPDKVMPGDTLIFTHTGGATYYQVFKVQKLAGDTSNVLLKNLVANNPTPGYVDFCVKTILRRGGLVIDDTTGNQVCNSVKFNGANDVDDPGTSEQGEIQHLHAFPNPTNKIVYLDYEVKANSPVVAFILDVAGRVVLEHHFGQMYEGRKQLSLDISTLNAGMYFVQVNENGGMSRGKILVQK